MVIFSILNKEIGRDVDEIFERAMIAQQMNNCSVKRIMC